ncbi:MAG: hypothetical protein IH898_13215 [Planctomycetes bacterium]|nr:hypothetical protein [Planctomycetota bacterium]
MAKGSDPRLHNGEVNTVVEKFLVTDECRRLARWLRLLGYDAELAGMGRQLGRETNPTKGGDPNMSAVTVKDEKQPSGVVMRCFYIDGKLVSRMNPNGPYAIMCSGEKVRLERWLRDQAALNRKSSAVKPQTPQGTALFRLDDHIQRLYDTAHILEMDIPYEFAVLRQACIDSVRENGFCLVEEVIPEARCAEIRQCLLATLERQRSSTAPKRVGFVPSVINHDQSFAPYLADPRLMKISKALLGEHLRISFTSPWVRIAVPG